MSYYDDWIAPNMFDVEEYLEQYSDIELSESWITADGRAIKYEDMETSHFSAARSSSGWRISRRCRS